MELTRRLDATHDMMFGRGLSNFARNAEATAQNVRTRLMVLLGEWFFDTEAGVPYLPEITQKPVDLAYAEAAFKKTILETDGVQQITSFAMDFNSATRKLTVTVSIATMYGTTENIQVIQ